MCPLLAQSVKILDFQCRYFEIQILWMPKGGSAVIGALKILTLPKRGRGGLTHAKIFWWICRSIPKTLQSDHSSQIVIIYPQKVSTCPPKLIISNN